MIKYLGFYILGRLALLGVPWMWPTSKGNAKGSVGKIDFYGPKTFVEQCTKAITEILPQYDETLKRNLTEGKAALSFYYEEKHSLTFHSVGLYTIPENIFRHKAEGICQYIVLRYFQSSEVGVGLCAALKDNSKKHRESMLVAREKMVEWLNKNKFPTKW